MKKRVLLLSVMILLAVVVGVASAAWNSLPNEPAPPAAVDMSSAKPGTDNIPEVDGDIYIQASGVNAGINVNNGPASYQVPCNFGRYYTLPAGTATAPARSWQNIGLTYPYPGVLKTTTFYTYLRNANVKVMGCIFYDGATTKQDMTLGTPVVGPGWKLVTYNNNDYSGFYSINTAQKVYNYGAASDTYAGATWWYGNFRT